MKKEKFKEDGKTRRCQTIVYGCLGIVQMAQGGFGGVYDNYQCRNGAKHDKNTRCKVHSKASVAAKKAKTIKREVAKAKALLKKHGNY